jgi:predicted outer membrane protein
VAKLKGRNSPYFAYQVRSYLLFTNLAWGNLCKDKIIVSAAAFALLSIAGTKAQAADPSILLNKANVINYEEIQMAKTAKSKAGDNQSLTFFAETLEADHKANEEALTALSRQKGVRIEGTPAEADVKVKELVNLDGGAFNEVFLKDEIADREKAIALFEHARTTFADDPDMELYIGQTIHIMQAHLEMAKGIHRHLSKSSPQSPANNKDQ